MQSLHLSYAFYLAGGKVVYCVNCGKDLTEKMNYCPECGTTTANTESEEYSIPSEDLVRRVKELISEGNVRRITVKNDEGATLLDIPVSVGVIGAILAPWMAAIGVIAAMVTHCKIIVYRRDDKSAT